MMRPSVTGSGGGRDRDNKTLKVLKTSRVCHRIYMEKDFHDQLHWDLDSMGALRLILCLKQRSRKSGLPDDPKQCPGFQFGMIWHGNGDGRIPALFLHDDVTAFLTNNRKAILR